MQYDHPLFRLGIFGISGSGKTTFALDFLRAARASCRFIWDPEGEFSHKLGLRPAATVAEITAAARSGWVCFDPWRLFSDSEQALSFFCDLAMEFSARLPGRKFFVVDELQEFITGHRLPDPLKCLVWRGRRRGLDSVFIGNAPNLLHNTIRGQLSEVVCFQLTDPVSLEWPAQYGFNPDEVRNLGPHQWIARTKNGGESRSRPLPKTLPGSRGGKITPAAKGGSEKTKHR